MRTNFITKTSGRKPKTITKGIIAIVTVVLALLVLQTLNMNPFSGLFHATIRPLLIFEHTVNERVVDFFSLIKSKRNLIEQNINLHDRVKELEPSAFLVDALKKENNELKALLNRTASKNAILASVLAKPSVSPYDTLVIDVGTQHGVGEGDLVTVHGDFIVGTIAEVFKKSALVTLFSSGGRETDVTLGENHLLVKALGRGGGNFETRLPRGVTIAEGDIVILPNISTQIFGIVERIEATPADQFQTILFKNPINMAEVKWVEVLRSKK
jgi:cell shape-determining protein MreC